MPGKLGKELIKCERRHQHDKGKVETLETWETDYVVAMLYAIDGRLWLASASCDGGKLGRVRRGSLEELMAESGK